MKFRQWIGVLLLLSTAATAGCELTGGHNLPPASRLAHPGPGVDGPGPGVLTPPMPPIAPASAELSVGGMVLPGGPVAPSTSNLVQVMFSRPESMQIQWDTSGSGLFDSPPLVTPGRQNFQQGAIYRLKLTNIPGEGREGIELYPTLEIGAPTYRTLAYLAHNAVPVQFTEEDFDQAIAGNFVTKVIYLPDPEFQGLAVADVATLVSTRLDPGLDPIEEANKKGSILAVVRLGNKDLEMPGTPMDAGVVPAGFTTAAALGTQQPGYRVESAGCQSGDCYGAPAGMAPAGMAPLGPVSGMNVPQYGMPVTGTPIGLPGPPHVPLGVPAGLKKHVMRNWTHRHIPDPVSKVKINVKQRPGLSYPQPASRAWIKEDTIHPNVHFPSHQYGAPSTGQIRYGGAGGLMPTR